MSVGCRPSNAFWTIASSSHCFVVAQHLDVLGDEALAPLGLTTKQWLLLAIVQKAFDGRHPTLTEAATVYGSSRQNVKAMARGIEAAGYLRIVPDAEDRRALRLVPTDRTAVFASADWRAREAAFFDRMFGGLTPDEISQLATLLGRWHQHLTASAERKSS